MDVAATSRGERARVGTSPNQSSTDSALRFDNVVCDEL